MARKKRAVKTRTVYRAAPKKRRSSKRTTGGKLKVFQPAAMAYGALRSPVSVYLSPYTAKLGVLGGLSDEAAMGIGSWAAAKYGKGFIKQVGLAGLTVENARTGEYAGSMLLGSIGGNAPQTSSSFYYG